MTRRLILLRHGQTHYNASFRMQGQLDTELSELGVRQAHAVGRVLAPRRPWTILSSDLRRARDTATALATEVELDVHTDPRLRETHLGTWQGMSHSEVDDQWPDARQQWRSSPRWSPPEGESRLDVARRTRAVVDELVEQSPEWNEHPAVLVAHGGAIAALTAALLELPVEQYPMFNGLGNTCWVQLSAHPRPQDSRGRAADLEVAPGTETARGLLWRLDQWNAGDHTAGGDTVTIRLVTDSASDLPREWIDEFDITVVDLHVVEEGDKTVSTAAVTPDQLATIYDELLADPECTGVVSVHLSRELSRTWQSAADAATRFRGRVLVSDSQGGGMSYGAAVAQCAWAARNGLGLSGVYELAERLCRGASTFAALESLEHLRRGGRISAVAAIFGSALSMRPVIVLRSGTVDLAAKARTTSKAHQRLRALLRDEIGRGEVLVVVHHHEALERAEEMATEIRKETQFPERVMIVEFDEVLAWHLGPGTVGVSVTELVDPEFPIPRLSPQATE